MIGKWLWVAVFFMPAAAGAQGAAEGDAPEALEAPEHIELSLEKRDYSPAEVKLLQELEERRIALDRREQAIILRERLVDLAEVRLKDKAGDLDDLRQEIEKLLENLSDKEEAELEQLAGIYEAMKAAAAASVLNRLDNNIVFDIFKRMKRKSTAKIMEKMAPAKARVISEMLAEKSDLPAFD